MTIEYRDETPFTGDDHTPTELANAIRTKKYGKDVREPIAQLAGKLSNAVLGQSIGSVVATPTKTFANLSELQKTYPNGADGVMVTVDNGHKYFWKNNDWVDGGVYQAAGIPQYFFGANRKIVDGEKGILKDFNSIPIEMANRAVAIGNNIRSIRNIPIDFGDKENSGLFMDLRSLDTDTTTGSIQFIFDTKNRGWYRIGWFKQNQYTNWKSIYNDEFLENTTVKSYVLTGKNGFKFSTVGLKKLTDEEFNQFVDLDFLPKKNLLAVYTSNILGENKLKNVPKEGGFNLVQTNANFINDSYTGTVQILTYPGGERFYRICWYGENNWTDWEKIATESDFNQNSISNTVLPAFESVAVIGDSYASGAIYSSDGINHKGDQYNKSWLASLSRKYGFDYYNYSVGGQTTWGWLSAPTRGLSQLKNDSVKELYIINLGINDANKHYNELGTSEDIATKENTFYGNLSRIYDEIKAKAPNSVIVFATIAINGIESKNYDDFSKAIEEVALYKNAPCLNLRNNKMIRPISETMVGGHPTALGYIQLGNVIDLELSKIITIDKYKQIFS